MRSQKSDKLVIYKSTIEFLIFHSRESVNDKLHVIS